MSGAGWDKVKVLDAWPESVSASAVSLEGSAFTRMQAYGAEVIYAAGAFNWRVQVGDAVSITDYRGARGTLCSERSPAEISWSLAQRVPAGTVDGWFGKKGKLAAAAAAAGNTAVLGDSLPAGARWEVISVADDPQLLALYGELIPVVTVDGRQVAVYRVEEAELSAALRG